MSKFAVVIETDRKGDIWKGTIRSLHMNEVEAEVAINHLIDELRKKAHIERLEDDEWEVGDTFQRAMENPKPGEDIEYLP